MTALDPYPADLAELDELPAGSGQVTAEDRLIRSINRLAQALEQTTLAILDNGQPARPQPVQNAPLAALPPVQPVQAQANGVCPIHGTPWKVVPAGVSKKTGNAYEAFRACSTAGCDQRPPR